MFQSTLCSDIFLLIEISGILSSFEDAQCAHCGPGECICEYLLQPWSLAVLVRWAVQSSMYIIVNATTITTYFGAQDESLSKTTSPLTYSVTCCHLESCIWPKNVYKLAVAAYPPCPTSWTCGFQSQTHTQTNETMQPDFGLFSIFSREILDFSEAHWIFSSSSYLVGYHTTGEGKKVLVLQAFFFSTGETILLEWWD